MRNRATIAAALGALMISVAGCGVESDYGSDPGVVIQFPAVTRPAVIYYNAASTRFGPSRYVVYDAGDFALQYSGSAGQYTGTHTRVGDVITFVFAVNSSTWSAKGTITGTSMLVEYSDDMLGSDFENGVYIRQ